MGLRLVTRSSLPEAIADAIADAIAMGRLLPGARIIESALTETLNVSRVPIREALKVMHAQGILVGEMHRGYRVAHLSQATVTRILEVRLMLETFLLRDAVTNWHAGHADPEDLRVAVAAMLSAAHAGDALASLRADLEFHRTIGKASQNDITVALWEAIARHVLITFSMEQYRDSDLFAVVQQHEAFLSFLQQQARHPGSVEDLREALQTHLLQVARTNRLPARQAGSLRFPVKRQRR